MQFVRLMIAALAAGAPAVAQNAAVLPFANRTAAVDPAQASLEWIGESIAETVRDAISAKGVITFSRAEDRKSTRLNSSH